MNSSLAIIHAPTSTLSLVPTPAPAPPPPPPTTPVKGRSFMSVYEEVQQRADDMLPDRIVRVADLKFSTTGNIVLPGAEYRIAGWALKQLASLVGVRWGKWFSTATPEERADEVTRRLARTPGELKVRAWRSHDNDADGTARALLSPGFSPIDDVRLFNSMHTMMRGLVEEYRFTTVQYTETTSQFAAVRTEALSIDGDVLYPGFNLRSSETGGAAISLDDYMLRLACLNGLMVRVGGKRSLYRTHRAIEDDALAAALVIAIGRLPERAATVVSWLSASKSILVPHPDDAVAAILGDSAEVPKALLEEAQRVVLRDGDNSRHGVIQAITLVAHSHPNTTPDARFAMEALAGQYLAATPAEAA